MQFLGGICRSLIFVLALVLSLSQQANALDSCNIPNGVTRTITEHGVCRRVSNNHASGSSIMVPTKTAAEWSTGVSAFLNALPAGVTVASCSQCGDTTSCGAPTGGSVVPGSQTFSTAGSFNFTVPCHNTLTVQVWGGGAGGQGFGTTAVSAGGQSSWDGTVLRANGGGAPSNGSFVGGTGGTASGGTTNTTGGAGGGGGGGANSGVGGAGANGGAGGATQSSCNGSGRVGTEPGGGGSGAKSQPRACNGMPGGGGGGYTTRTWSAGTYLTSEIVPLVVGAGSAGGTGGNPGGNGAKGRVTITWN
jgi:hypothetical protein